MATCVCLSKYMYDKQPRLCDTKALAFWIIATPLDGRLIHPNPLYLIKGLSMLTVFQNFSAFLSSKGHCENTYLAQLARVFPKQNNWILISFDLNSLLTRQMSEKAGLDYLFPRFSLLCTFAGINSLLFPKNVKNFSNWRGLSPPSPPMFRHRK